MLTFQPKTSAQLAIQSLLPVGEYDFEVIEASPKVSQKTGAEMIALKLRIFTPDGSQRTVRDFLMSKMEAKLRHFCDATGLTSQYESGQLTHGDCLSRSGRCKIVIREDKTGQYEPKNEVRDYIVKPSSQSSPKGANNDDLPY